MLNYSATGLMIITRYSFQKDSPDIELVSDRLRTTARKNINLYSGKDNVQYVDFRY